MVGIYCSVLGCWEPYGGKASKHAFPNPSKDIELFKKWKEICGNKRLYEDDMTDEKIFRTCRVCRKHFSTDDFLPNNVLKRTAFPHVNIPHLAMSESANKSTEIKEATSSNIGETIIPSLTLRQTEINTPSTSYDRRYIQTEEIQIEEETPAISGLEHTETLDTPSTSRDRTDVHTEEIEIVEEAPTTPPRRPSSGLLSEVNVNRSVELTPKARHLYKRATYFKRRAAASKKCKMSLVQRLDEATKFTDSEMFEKVVSSMDRIKARFFQSQLHNINKSPHGRRYSLDDKVLGLAFFKQCGSGYKLLSKIFALPSRKTVMRLLNRIPVRPGLCEAVFDVLKAEVKTFKDPLQKYCVLIFDEMSVKPGLHWNSLTGSVEGFENFGYKKTDSVANHVQVFMLRGIKKKWKQPIFYNFVSGATKYPDIVHIIKLIIERCASVGLEVVATICDQGKNNEAAVKSLVASTRAKYINKEEEFDDSFFEVGDRKVIPIFDAPHLIKGLRNNFLKYNVQFTMDGTTNLAKWEHIVKAYKMDPYLGSLRTMPKLTDRHVNPSNVNKMKVSFCTQVLSRTVAAAINLMAFSGTKVQTEGEILAMEKEAMETAKFLEFADKLFDSVNGSSIKANLLKPLRGPVQENSPHFTFWNDAITVLLSMKFLKDDGSSVVPPSITNFVKTLRNFKVLYTMLRDIGFEQLVPRMFNQDPIENFFGRIRQRGARYNNPTCAAFTPFYKSLLVKDLTSSHSVGANCEDDSSEIFITLQRLVSQGLPEDEDSESEHEVDIGVVPLQFPNSLSTIELQVLKYVCGFLIKKAQTSYNNCSCAKKILEVEEMGEESADLFIRFKQYENCKLKYVSNYFLFLMTQALHIIKFVLNTQLHKEHIFEHLFRILCDRVNFTECEHNSDIKKSVFTYFLKIMGHDYLKQLNRILSGQDRRPIPQNAPKIFKICKDIFKKTYKK